MEAQEKLLAAGGVLGAIAASSCCVLPLVLVSLGVTGTWIGSLSVLAPYKPIFIAGTVGLLGYGYYLAYGKPKEACAPGESCARPLPNRFVKIVLWGATVLVAIAALFDCVVPLLLNT
jgi:mercuric ion transport protein